MTNRKNTERGGTSEHQGRGSQDAVRHEEDGRHHKYHTRTQKTDRHLPAGAQQDLQPGDGQPEIPKVGSRDAPGG